MKDLTGTNLPPLIDTDTAAAADTSAIPENRLPNENTEKPIDFEKKTKAPPTVQY